MTSWPGSRRIQQSGKCARRLAAHRRETMAVVRLRPKRDASLRRRHPWVFAGAIGGVTGSVARGETVDVVSAEGEWLAYGAYSPDSEIRVRVWSFDREERVSPDFFKHRIEQAVRERNPLLSPDVYTACRLVNAESTACRASSWIDTGEVLVCQFLSAGPEFWKNEIVRTLVSVTQPASVYERSDVDIRKKKVSSPSRACSTGRHQSLTFRSGKAGSGSASTLSEDTRPDSISTNATTEPGSEATQRARTSSTVSPTPAPFGVYALDGGAAHVTRCDSSAEALELARENAALNGLPTDRLEYVDGDVFQVLRRYRDARRQFDLIVLDPPKFVTAARRTDPRLPGIQRRQPPRM